MSHRPLHEIAKEIKADWTSPNSAAAPCLEAMEKLNSIDDSYGLDSGVEIVARFRSLSSGWHGETARRVKDELDSLLKP